MLTLWWRLRCRARTPHCLIRETLSNRGVSKWLGRMLIGFVLKWMHMQRPRSCPQMGTDRCLWHPWGCWRGRGGDTYPHLPGCLAPSPAHTLPTAPSSLAALPAGLQLLAHCPPIPPPPASAWCCSPPYVPVPRRCLPHSPAPAAPACLPAPGCHPSRPSRGPCPLARQPGDSLRALEPWLFSVSPPALPRELTGIQARGHPRFLTRWVKMRGLILSHCFHLGKLGVNVYGILLTLGRHQMTQ